MRAFRSPPTFARFERPCALVGCHHEECTQARALGAIPCSSCREPLSYEEDLVFRGEDAWHPRCAARAGVVRDATDDV